MVSADSPVRSPLFVSRLASKYLWHWQLRGKVKRGGERRGEEGRREERRGEERRGGERRGEEGEERRGGERRGDERLGVISAHTMHIQHSLVHIPT